jgi:hypothetical protein
MISAAGTLWIVYDHEPRSSAWAGSRVLPISQSARSCRDVAFSLGLGYCRAAGHCTCGDAGCCSMRYCIRGNTAFRWNRGRDGKNQNSSAAIKRRP